MKNEQSTQENTQENKPKRGRPHKQPEQFVFGRRISGTAEFWEELDLLAKDCNQTVNQYLRYMVFDRQIEK